MNRVQKKKKKIKIFRIILLLFFIFLIAQIYSKYNYKISKFVTNIFTTSNYKIIKQDQNSNYSGVGQEQLKNKDGYFTTFTTTGKNPKKYIEFKQNGDSSWSKNTYWGGTMEDNGCGITAMSIVLSGYNKNYTPEDLRKKYYPVLNYENFSKELSDTFGIENSDFYYDSIHRSEQNITEHLKTNKPIIICVWNENSNNRWTNKSHYMVLLAADEHGMVYVSNPNGLENDSKSSGWYDFDEVLPYIAKILYIEE